MAKKIFISYKHSDNSVYTLTNYGNTARSYVDYLIENKMDDEIYKGEGNEDLSDFKDETIESHLKNKIYDSSITIVLISPNMKDLNKPENDQWIPWEISYSLKEITRENKTSHINGILAIVLPDCYNSYEYFIKTLCGTCNSKQYHTDTSFQILKNNMFNNKKSNSVYCEHYNINLHTGDHSYIPVVTWNNFLQDKEKILERIDNINKNKDDYKITKEVIKN